MQKCENLVYIFTASDGEVIELPCGRWYAGERLICDDCQENLLKDFPQGWRHTPGDLCPHGVYVGGCAEDHMCLECELGEPQHG
jgi:hypothetical protein